jgi:succinoglycan biosynthesis protein ExoM
MRPDVSVCIATYRRPESLARLLASLSRLKLAAEPTLEILIVDNDPQRSAAATARSLGEFPHPVRWLEDPRPNIAHARNRAVDLAEGRWLAFIDDDEVADEHWLAAYWQRAAEAECDGWLGPVLAPLEENVSGWLDPETFYARPRYATGTLLGRASLRTSNAFVRRALFEGREGRRFDPAFGRSGGEDCELFGRMLQAGARFCWCDEAIVTEFVPAARYRLAWLGRRAFRGGVVHTRLEQRRLGRGSALVRGGSRALAGLLLFATATPLAALAGRPAAARAWLRTCTQAGHLWALLGGGCEEYGAD